MQGNEGSSAPIRLLDHIAIVLFQLRVRFRRGFWCWRLVYVDLDLHIASVFVLHADERHISNLVQLGW